MCYYTLFSKDFFHLFFELSQAKPSRAKPSQAEPSWAKLSQAEPSWAKLSQAEPSWAKLSHAEEKIWEGLGKVESR